MRRSFRTALALAVSLAALLVGASPALAGANWCEGDPVFSVGGNIVDITTSFTSDNLDDAGALAFELLVPSNAILPAVVSLNGSVPVRGTISRSLPPSYSVFGMPVVLRVSMNAARTFTTYTRVTGVTKWGWRTTLLNTVAGPSTSVQQYSFTLPLF